MIMDGYGWLWYVCFDLFASYCFVMILNLTLVSITMDEMNVTTMLNANESN